MKKQYFLTYVAVVAAMLPIFGAPVTPGSGKELLDAILARYHCPADVKSQELYEKAAFDLMFFLAGLKRQNVDFARSLYLHEPVHWAAAKGHRAVIEILLSCNAPFDNLDVFSGKTPLHMASQAGRYGAVTILVNAGADVSSTDSEGKTPLHLAAENDAQAIVRFLLRQGGANIDAEDNQGNTAIHSAAKAGNPEVIQFLMEQSAVIKENNNGETPLNLALDSYAQTHSTDSSECVKRLVLFGVPTTQADRDKLEQLFPSWQRRQWFKQREEREKRRARQAVLSSGLEHIKDLEKQALKFLETEGEELFEQEVTPPPAKRSRLSE